MRTEEEVLQRFRDVYARALESRREKYLSVGFMNCTFNVRRRLKKHGMVGFCTNAVVTKGERNGVAVCNDDECAVGCGQFSCHNTDASVEADLHAVMENPNLCGQEYPKLAVLLWFLQRTKPEPSRFLRAWDCFVDVGRSVWSFIRMRWW